MGFVIHFDYQKPEIKNDLYFAGCISPALHQVSLASGQGCVPSGSCVRGRWELCNPGGRCQKQRSEKEVE